MIVKFYQNDYESEFIEHFIKILIEKKDKISH